LVTSLRGTGNWPRAWKEDARVRNRSIHVDVARRIIAGPNEGPDNGLGDGGHRLHEWLMEGGGVDGKIVELPSDPAKL
jgi:hypothetical protein